MIMSRVRSISVIMKSSIVRRYRIPALITCGVFAIGLVVFPRSKTLPSKPADAPEQEFLEWQPYGRCLVAIVERNGVFVGQDRIDVDAFAGYYDRVLRAEKPQSAMIYGTKDSRYGDFVRVYAALRKELGNDVHVFTVSVPEGKRWNAIEIVKDGHTESGEPLL